MSSSTYLILDQHNRYLDTHDQWAASDSGEPPFHTPHHDVALNKLFELTLVDADLRGRVEATQQDDQGHPRIPADCDKQTPQASKSSPRRQPATS